MLIHPKYWIGYSLEDHNFVKTTWFIKTLNFYYFVCQNQKVNNERASIIHIFLVTHMGHQDQDGGKVGQMSLFDWKFEAARDREKQKFIHFQVLQS